ncbi:hypothetical protein Anas_06841 [Armadillidium nasatum]|uniref:Transmembrane protein n=1 Tax=Armadillidium nasatum TaxID=96803 RepID=A0A5N5TNE5_9CRUS|nr:hypothetical protein Anas_06841 [Armadillidium nasatum]
MADLVQTMPKTYWCGFRVVLLLGLITAVSAYTVGAILAGVAFHSWNYDVTCSVMGDNRSWKEKFEVAIPLKAVGPSMMSFGGGIFFIIFIEWFFVKPYPTFMVA